MGVLSEQAERMAAQFLAAPLPRRWRHVRGVAVQAARISTGLSEPDAETLIASAWLHDIGYSPAAVSTGLHALDGARLLRNHSFPERVCGLVAYHSCALFEATERGLTTELTTEFDDERSPVTDALWYADMTTGPDGEPVKVAGRLEEIRQRYGPQHLVTRFWAKAEPTMTEAVRRAEQRLSDQPM